MYDETTTLEAKELDVYDPDWPEDPSEYVLLVSAKEDLFMNRIPEDFDHLVDENECNYLHVQFAEPEELSVWVTGEEYDFDELSSY